MSDPVTNDKPVEVTTPGDSYSLSGDFRGAVINIKSTIIGAAEAQELENLPPEPGESPYQGLQYFDEKDSDRFFGRELLTAKLVNRLSQTRFLAIIGASGSGKSSLIRAGVIPALRRGEALADGSMPPTDSGRLEFRLFTPGGHPLEALAATLLCEADSVSLIASLQQEMAENPRSLALAARRLLAQLDQPRLFLVIDQFEELFTQCHNDQERRTFIQNLLAAVEPNESLPISVVMILRADFYARLADFDQLRELVSHQQEFIGAMTRDELFQAIVRPAALGNWKIEEGLVKVFLDDIGDEPGALPLLSHALRETWLRRRGRTMTLSGYTESGGIRGAIAKTAETIFSQRLTPQQQPIARMIFMRLAELGDDSQDTRRRATFSELITRSTDQATIEAVLSILVDARLVTTGIFEPDNTETIEVAHEALIREWPTLQQWLNEDRESLVLQRQVTDAANEWLKFDRDPGALYRGARLQQALAWADKNSSSLSLNEQEFLDASRLAAEKEARQAEQFQRVTRRRKVEIIAISATALIGVMLALLFGGRLLSRFGPAPKMDGIYNIAVAEIGLIQPDGTVTAADNQAGQKVSGWVAGDLKQQVQDDPNLLVWQDSPELAQRNVVIGRVEGQTSEQKIVAAEQMASRLGADMVIFGDIDSRVSPAELRLEIWIAPQLEYDFQEIQGRYQSESPIPILKAADPGLEAQPEIRRQAGTIAWLAIGLTRVQLGQSSEALDAFQKAAALSPDSKTVQFFIGRENLFLSDRDAARQEEYTSAAEAAFQQSLSSDSQYARGLIGLGSVYFAKAKRLALLLQRDPNRGDGKQLAQKALSLADQATSAYHRVLAANAPPAEYGVPVDLVARLGLGTTFRLQGEINQYLGQADQAEQAIQQSVQTLEALVTAFQQQKLERYLALTYETLGTAYQWQGYLQELKTDYPHSLESYQQAAKNFDQCIELGKSSPDLIIKNDYAAMLCVPYRKDIQNKIDNLSGASG